MEKQRVNGLGGESPTNLSPQLKDKCSRYWGRMFSILKPASLLPGQLSNVLYNLFFRFFDHLEKVNRDNEEAMKESVKGPKVLGNQRKFNTIR